MQQPTYRLANSQDHNHSNFLYRRKESLQTPWPNWMLLISLIFQKSIMSLPSVQPRKSRNSPHTSSICMTSKSIWKKVDACTHSLHQNWGPSEHLLKTMLGLVSSDPQTLPMECLSSSSRKRMAVYDFVLTIMDLTKSARRIIILFPSFLTCLIHRGKPTHS